MRRFAALLLGLLLSVPGAAAPRAESVVRYAPNGDLRVLDPIWTSAAITVTHAQLEYDVLVTMDSALTPQLQMAESVATSPDRLTWSFTLRPGLAFHDGTPVRAADVAASIRRWARRVTTGQAMMPRVAGIDAIDARTLRLVLSKPFGPVMEVLGTPVLAPFVMREAEANVDAFEQVKTVMGSGPYIWDAAGYQPGHRAVYRRNPAYIPRAEPSDGYAGGKVAKFDIVEWLYLPDPSTVTQALMKGEVDLIDPPQADLIPLLAANRDVVVEVLNTAGVIGTIRPNSLVPPFDNPKARAALQLLMDQKLYDAAIASQPAYAQECYAVFVCGTPYATDIAAGPWKQANIARARQLLAEAGYRGEPIVLLDPADQADIHMLALITADQLRRAGAKVQVQTMDWSTVLTRRNVKDPPATNPNGWNIAFTFWGGLSLSSPISNAPLVSRCDGRNLYGWPCDAAMFKLMSEDFLDAATPAAQMKVIEAIQTRFYETFPYIATGIIRRPIARRADLVGLPHTQYPVFWNVARTGR
ncbi:MAG: ABC transporter substrate-binding protein [Acetobacteraceae bacterium]|nr:ABC transporter substrate-binding protein [Acetobacteraceae bacterium]